MGSIEPAPLFQVANYGPAVNLPEPYPGNTTFPLALSPSNQNTPLTELTQEISHLSKAGEIQKLLKTHGAIYFKDLNLKDVDEFSRFAHAFGWAPHEDIGNPVRRTVLAKNVATANEGPNTQPVYPHNEFGLSPHFPAYVFFYCISAPTSGGETPINNSIVLYHHLKERHPEFIAKIEEKGVKYQLFYPNTSRTQTTSPGNSVLQAYGTHVLDTDDTATARSKSKRRSEDCRLRNGCDLRVWQHLPAIRTHPHSGLPSFFNNTISRFLNALAADTLLPPHINKDGKYQPPVFYGDGELIPRKYFDSAVEIIGETRSLVTWKEGDVLLLDNLAVQHAREPWVGKRVLAASLWNEA
ncbi:hypothetical protein BDV96DRAFT_615335 [Lophiotrema nucula]|uniref:TauD/TfdA-like domain-containing protein n=1 Tax=Lophiotrema nucula TaxID=690887 RepID=A0A6A5YTC7_9PLEO|nr:hypothetical protein BDV96DRAFT_615335 [Lophiotrema nucula]